MTPKRIKFGQITLTTNQSYIASSPIVARDSAAARTRREMALCLALEPADGSVILPGARGTVADTYGTSHSRLLGKCLSMATSLGGAGRRTVASRTAKRFQGPWTAICALSWPSRCWWPLPVGGAGRSSTANLHRLRIERRLETYLPHPRPPRTRHRHLFLPAFQSRPQRRGSITAACK